MCPNISASINPVDSFLENSFFFFLQKHLVGTWERIVPKYNQIAVTRMKKNVKKKFLQHFINGPITKTT